MTSYPPFQTIYFDIVGGCVARCPYCLTGIGETRKGSEIAPGRFAEALKKLRDEGAIGAKTIVSLYNWGEPFLHSDFPGILRVVNDLGVRYALSTNAYRVPVIDREFVRNLDHLIFSMCGFSQVSYDRIQRTRFDTARDNITRIVRECRDRGFRGDFRIYFHVYRFNESEIGLCKRFANRHGILFHPHYAILNRWDDLRSLVEGGMPPEMVERISGDLYGLEEIPGILADAPREGYRCPQYDFLVLTEHADVVLCCQLPKDRPEFHCGNILQEGLADILERRQEMPVCRDCLRSGLAFYVNQSIRTPAFYRKGLRQTLLFLRHRLRRALPGVK